MVSNFDDEQRQSLAEVDEFINDHVVPRAEEMDVEDVFPYELIDKAGERGLLGMTVPQTLGGRGFDSLTYVMAVEHIAKVSAAVALILSANNSLVCPSIMEYGSEAQKAEFARPLAEGDLGAFALTEPGAGSDVSSLQTMAVEDDGEYEITGEKMFITNGGECDTMLVFARTDTEGREITAFLVDSSSPGISIEGFADTMGMRGSHQAEISLDGVRVPEDNMLGEEGDGFRIALSALDRGRLGIGAQAVGIAQAAVEHSIEFAKSRKQFGKSISEFESISGKIADMVTDIKAARLMVHNAAQKKERGENFHLDASMAKLFASRVAIRATGDAVYIHGGRGYLKGSGVERYFRDAKVTEIYEGTSDIQRMVISRGVLR